MIPGKCTLESIWGTSFESRLPEWLDQLNCEYLLSFVLSQYRLLQDRPSENNKQFLLFHATSFFFTIPKSLSRQIHSAEHPVEKSRRSFEILNCMQQRKISENKTQLIREKGAQDFLHVLGDKRISFKYMRKW